MRLFIAFLALFPLVLSASAQETPQPSIVVQATGEAVRAPDMATVLLEVTRTAPTAREALDANSEAMTAVLAAMKEAGIEERDLQTSSFNIRPELRYDEPRTQPNQPPKPPVVTGYTVSNALSVRIREIAKVGSVLDQAVSLGVNSGGGISFGSSKIEEAREEARADAVKRALAKARTLSTAAGVELGSILSIEEFLQRGDPMPARMRMAESSMAGDVPVAAGEQTMSVSVTLRLAIVQ